MNALDTLRLERSTRSWLTHNIPPEICLIADNYAYLVPMSTGGNMDYVVRQFEGGAVAVLSAVNDAGSPATPDAPACVDLWIDDTWTKGWTIGFPSVTRAIQWMAEADLSVIVPAW